MRILDFVPGITRETVPLVRARDLRTSRFLAANGLVEKREIKMTRNFEKVKFSW